MGFIARPSHTLLRPWSPLSVGHVILMHKTAASAWPMEGFVGAWMGELANLSRVNKGSMLRGAGILFFF